MRYMIACVLAFALLAAPAGAQVTPSGAVPTAQTGISGANAPPFCTNWAQGAAQTSSTVAIPNTSTTANVIYLCQIFVLNVATTATGTVQVISGQEGTNCSTNPTTIIPVSTPVAGGSFYFGSGFSSIRYPTTGGQNAGNLGRDICLIVGGTTPSFNFVLNYAILPYQL